MTDESLLQVTSLFANKKSIHDGDFVSFWMYRKFEIDEWDTHCGSDEILELENHVYEK